MVGSNLSQTVRLFSSGLFCPSKMVSPWYEQNGMSAEGGSWPPLFGVRWTGWSTRSFDTLTSTRNGNLVHDMAINNLFVVRCVVYHHSQGNSCMFSPPQCCWRRKYPMPFLDQSGPRQVRLAGSKISTPSRSCLRPDTFVFD